MKTYNKKRLSVLFMFYLLVFTAFASTSPDSGGMQKMLNPGDVPEGLSSSQWKSIQSQIKANKYKTYAAKQGGVNSSNPAHGWHIHYGTDGTDGTTTLKPLETDATPYHLAMRLTGIGYPAPGQALVALQTPQRISHHDKTLDYHWTANLTERWMNSETDLEQWFLLKQRPQGAKEGVALTVQMTLDSDLTVKQKANSLHFSHPSGAKISYNKLKVWDATGRQLPAHMKHGETFLYKLMLQIK